MAKDVKIKGAWFNLSLPEESALCQYADSINFSDWVKKKLYEDMNSPEEEKPALDPVEISLLVESLLETKLAGLVIPASEVKIQDIQLELDQFF
ncbi:MAG: hypothetical protein AB7E31_16330 [Desulfitobacterium sp.]